VSARAVLVRGLADTLTFAVRSGDAAGLLWATRLSDAGTPRYASEIRCISRASILRRWVWLTATGVGQRGDFVLRSIIAAAATGVFVAGASVLATASAEAAVPAASTVALTVFQMPAGGDAPAAGEREFDLSNATLAVSYDLGESVAVAASNPDGTNATLSLFAGIGASRFSLGYRRAVSSPSEPGSAGLGLTVDGEGCEAPGDIDVRDVAYSGTTITRLDVVWQQYCQAVPGQASEEGNFGELTIGEPAPSSVLLGSRVIEFPPVPVGAASNVVPIVISNRGSSSVTVSTPTISGSNPGAFGIMASTCGRTLAAHKDCSISLHFLPHVAGARSARLAVTVAGVSRAVELDATTFPGSSVLTAITGGGRVPGSGTNYDFTQANAVFLVSSGPLGLTASVDDDFFAVTFAGPNRTMPTVGTYSTGANPVAGAPFVSVTGPGSGCDQLAGSFTVKQAAYTSYGVPGYQFPLHIDIVYSEHCVGGTNTMSGEFAYDTVPTVTSPPAVTALSAAKSGASVAVHWTNPTHTWAYTVLRVQQANANDPNAQAFSGTPVYSGTGAGATISGLTHGVAYTVSAFTVDSYGDVTGPTQTPITP
jgi:hypothetical protein